MAVQPLRVLHLHSGNLYGGVERMLVTIARYQRPFPDVRHEFALCWEGRNADELRAVGATVSILQPVRLSRPWTVLGARRSLERVRRTNGFDVAVCHQAWTHVVFGGGLRRSRTPFVHYLHSPIEQVGILERLSAITPPARIVAVSRHAAASAPRLFPGTPVDVVHNPMPWEMPVVSPEARQRTRHSLGVGPDDVLIIQVSRVDPCKGHHQLLDALSLMKDVPTWKMVFVGGAQRPQEVTYAADLAARARELGLAERVVFTGERRDVPDLMGAADVYAQANANPEGLGIAFMEAFAAAVPVVTMKFGGALDIVDDSSGILVEPGDVPGVAAALRRLVADPHLRTTMGRHGRALVLERFDPNHQIRRLNDVLIGVASAAGRTS